MLNVLLILAIVLVGFAIAFHVLLGHAIAKYRTFSDAAITLLLVVFGDFDLEEIIAFAPLLGVALMLAFVVIMTFIILTMLLKIVDVSYGEVLEESTGARGTSRGTCASRSTASPTTPLDGPDPLHALPRGRARDRRPGAHAQKLPARVAPRARRPTGPPPRGRRGGGARRRPERLCGARRQGGEAHPAAPPAGLRPGRRAEAARSTAHTRRGQMFEGDVEGSDVDTVRRSSASRRFWRLSGTTSQPL